MSYSWEEVMTEQMMMGVAIALGSVLLIILLVLLGKIYHLNDDED